jgi:hypothetical protein
MRHIMAASDNSCPQSACYCSPLKDFNSAIISDSTRNIGQYPVQSQRNQSEAEHRHRFGPAIQALSSGFILRKFDSIVRKSAFNFKPYLS